MSIKDTYKHLRELLSNVVSDLEKSENGNKAASQRVRTGTVKLEKLAKLFRKESIVFEKKNKGVKKPAKSAAGTKKASPASKGTSKTAPKPKSSSAGPKSKGVSVKAKPKTAQARTSVRSRHLSVKRATAKLPTRRLSAQ